jgi:hypothetical protein
MFAVALYSGTENPRGECPSSGTALRLRVFPSGGDALQDRTPPGNREGELGNGRAIPLGIGMNPVGKTFPMG